MSDEILRRKFADAYEPGSEFPSRLLVSPTMALIDLDPTKPDSRRSDSSIPRASLRLAAALMLLVLAIASTVVFVATHHTATPSVPATSTSTSRALSGAGMKTRLMMDAKTGWWAPGGGLVVTRTTDGGASWHDVLTL